MTPAAADAPRLLVVGGCTGLVGRAVLAEFGGDRRIRSVHRRPAPSEAAAGVEWVGGDASELADWKPLLQGVDTVLTLAWYRQARRRRFRRLAEGLLRLVRDAETVGIRRFVHVSVPDAPTASRPASRTSPRSAGSTAAWRRAGSTMRSCARRCSSARGTSCCR